VAADGASRRRVADAGTAVDGARRSEVASRSDPGRTARTAEAAAAEETCGKFGETASTTLMSMPLPQL